jgi:hypothetical protein
VFNAHGVKLAFENHDHSYKRTKPLINSSEAAGGTVYMGDGAWGVESRSCDASRDYIEICGNWNYFFAVSSNSSDTSVRTIAPDGSLFDSFSFSY